jgi:hypothetical protein
MHLDMQSQIETLYEGEIPVDIIEDISCRAQERGMSAELAAVYVITEAYISGQFDVKYLTLKGYKMLIHCIRSKCYSVRKYQPEETELIQAYDDAIADLVFGYEMKKDPVYTLDEISRIFDD